jgi:diguanylate cyclase (GGDEF)-like protein
LKQSIKKIFNNLKLSLYVLFFLSAVFFLFFLEQNLSYTKINILNEEKSIMDTLLQDTKKAQNIDMIKINSLSAKLTSNIDKLIKQKKYNFISNTILNNSKEDIQKLKNLNSKIDEYIKKFRKYHKLSPSDKNLKKLTSLHNTIKISIDSILLENIYYDNARFKISSKIFLIFFILLIITVLYSNKLTSIYSDIKLLSLNKNKKDIKIYSTEIDSILTQIANKLSSTENSSTIDKVTQIYNNKGMFKSYSEKKSLNESNSSCLAILEIDNFSKDKRVYTQEITQTILRKVAYIISLHQQQTDIVARTDYNQFTLIFSRASKEQLFKSIDNIRESISEVNLVDADDIDIKITVTGGFTLKPYNSPLEEYIKKAKEILKSAKEIEKNRIFDSKKIVT